jgi:uncharacterized phage protein (TIGR02220 family)
MIEMPNMLVNEIKTEKVEIEPEQDIIFISIGLYKLFLAKEGGRDAFNLFMHLQFTARLQNTRQVWAKDKYLLNGLKMGKVKLKKAKSFLRRHGLISYIQRKKKDGTFLETYINIRHAYPVKLPGGTKNVPAVDLTGGIENRPTGDSPQIPKERKGEIPRDKKRECRVPFKLIVDYLNEKTGKNFKPGTNGTQRHITARWNEGFREQDFRDVIDIKTKKWGEDDKMKMYLRPETLFGPKFEGYLNEKPKTVETIVKRKVCPECEHEYIGSCCNNCGWSK